MKNAVSGVVTPTNNDINPLKRVIPKRTKLRDFDGCSPLRDYELLEKIGEGTFGEVHKARQRKSKDLVALKRILMHNEKDGFPITALREIKILKMLSHPNVIRLSDMTIERGDKAKKKRGSIYMVTPYMDHDLCGLLNNSQVDFSVGQIKCYMLQLLEGTRYLHSMHILHRDMKAANLLISNQGILQIADFGLARMFTDDPPAGSNEPRREYTNMVVTRWYRPPELLLGERKYTPAIDLWGIGCILAEMYKGAPILQGQSDIEQLNMIFNLCGTPTESTMPGWTLLPGCEGIRSFKSYPRQLERNYEKHGRELVVLLAGLLDLDPSRRFTATQALDDVYFKTEPLPAEPGDLPDYEASHEFDKRRNDTNRRDTRVPKAPDAAGQMVGGNSNAQAMAPRETAPPQGGTYDRRRQLTQEPPARDAREPPRDHGSRYDDRPRRDDRPRESYGDRPRDRDWNRGPPDRERDRDRGHAVDTYIPAYSKARGSPPRRDRSRDRYSADPRDHRSNARDFYDDGGRPVRRYDRDDRDRRRSRSRSRSRERR